MIRLIIIEDQTIIRESLEQSLTRNTDFEIVGSWASAEEAILYLKNGEADVAIVDNMLPGMDGSAFIRHALLLKPSLKSLMLSMYTHQSIVCQAFDAGAFGFLPKDVPMNELIAAIRTVAKGESVLSTRLTKKLMVYQSKKRNKNNIHSILNDEQKKILIMAAEGLGNKEISEKIGCSVSTVKHHFTEILKALEAKDRTHAVAKAIKAGFIEIAPEVFGSEKFFSHVTAAQ